MQDKQDDAFIRIMEIDAHSPEYLDNGLSEIETIPIQAQEQPAAVPIHSLGTVADYTLQQIFGVTPAVPDTNE